MVESRKIALIWKKISKDDLVSLLVQIVIEKLFEFFEFEFFLERYLRARLLCFDDCNFTS